MTVSLLYCRTVCRSVMSDSVTPWTRAHQAALSMGVLQARTLERVAISFSSGSSQPRDWTWVSCIAGGFFTHWATREAHCRIWAYQSETTLSYIVREVSSVLSSLPPGETTYRKYWCSACQWTPRNARWHPALASHICPENRKRQVLPQGPCI